MTSSECFDAPTLAMISKQHGSDFVQLSSDASDSLKVQVSYEHRNKQLQADDDDNNNNNNKLRLVDKIVLPKQQLEFASRAQFNRNLNFNLNKLALVKLQKPLKFR